MFKGIVFFIKNGWKYDKLYIIWRLLFQFINAKYDVRIEQYKRGEKQWDTNVSIIMVIRGIK